MAGLLPAPSYTPWPRREPAGKSLCAAGIVPLSARRDLPYRPGVKILIGKISAHCPECYGEEWRSLNGSERPDVTDDVVCLSCGHQLMCADLVLQLPIDQTGTLPSLN